MSEKTIDIVYIIFKFLTISLIQIIHKYYMEQAMVQEHPECDEFLTKSVSKKTSALSIFCTYELFFSVYE